MTTRFSRGMSTPARRAILVSSSHDSRRCGAARPCCQVPGLRARGCASRVMDAVLPIFDYYAQVLVPGGDLALTLFMAWIFADHHDPPVTANHLALVADRLHARVNLHGLGPLRLLFQWNGNYLHAAGGPVARKSLLVAVDDASAIEVVRAEFHHYAVLREDPDVVLTHLARDSGKDHVSVRQLNAEHRVGKCFRHGAFYLDDTLFLGHILR